MISLLTFSVFKDCIECSSAHHNRLPSISSSSSFSSSIFHPFRVSDIVLMMPSRARNKSNDPSSYRSRVKFFHQDIRLLPTLLGPSIFPRNMSRIVSYRRSFLTMYPALPDFRAFIVLTSSFSIAIFPSTLWSVLQSVLRTLRICQYNHITIWLSRPPLSCADAFSSRNPTSDKSFSTSSIHPFFGAGLVDF